jgi:hypothetical protein
MNYGAVIQEKNNWQGKYIREKPFSGFGRVERCARSIYKTTNQHEAALLSQTANQNFIGSTTRDRAEDVETTFRVSGQFVEMASETGRREPTSYSFANGRTKYPHLEPFDAVFMVLKTRVPNPL